MALRRRAVGVQRALRRRGVRRRPAVRGGRVCVRSRVLPGRLLRRPDVPGRRRDVRVRQERQRLRGLHARLRGGRLHRRVRRDHVLDRLLLGGDVPPTEHQLLRGRRRGVHGVPGRHRGRVRRGRVPLRRGRGVRGRAAVRRGALRLRRDLVPGGLLRWWRLPRRRARRLRRGRRHLRGVRSDDLEHVRARRRVPVREQPGVQPGPALRRRAVRVRRDDVPRRLLPRRGVPLDRRAPLRRARRRVHGVRSAPRRPL